MCGQIWMANKREISHPDVDGLKSKIGDVLVGYFHGMHRRIFAMAFDVMCWRFCTDEMCKILKRRKTVVQYMYKPNGSKGFYWVPVLLQRYITFTTRINFILHNKPPGYIKQIQLYGGGCFLRGVSYTGALYGSTLIFLVSARCFVRLTKKNYNCATPCCINFLEKFMQNQNINVQTNATFSIYWHLLVTAKSTKWYNTARYKKRTINP